ncbi:MAG: site-specific integrase [Peptoniphilus harei]|nr:site-specific integrase [Peptoniphilus harei]
MGFKKQPILLDSNQKLFLKVKEIEQISPDSIKGYVSFFSTVENKIGGRLNYDDENELSLQVLDYFQKISHFKNSSYNTAYKHARAYFNYLVKIDKLENNPLTLMGIKERKEEFNPRPCDTEDLKKLLKVIDTDTYAGLRDYTAILLIVDTGIRPAEAFRLIDTDVVFEKNIINIRKEVAKTSQERVLPVSVKVMIYVRALLKYNKSEYVFATINGDQFSTDRFRTRMNRYNWYADVHITPYQLRHYFGTEYARSDNCNILYLQKILGHSKLEMTRRYVKIETEDLARNHKLASPIDKLD